MIYFSRLFHNSFMQRLYLNTTPQSAMTLTIENFESQIDNTILNRGYAYYESGKIISLEQTSDTSWEAIVSGTQNYTVIAGCDHFAISKIECDCPYDYGPICKHMVAVIYKLQEIKGAGMKKSRE